MTKKTLEEVSNGQILNKLHELQQQNGEGTRQLSATSP